MKTSWLLFTLRIYYTIKQLIFKLSCVWHKLQFNDLVTGKLMVYWVLPSDIIGQS